MKIIIPLVFAVLLSGCITGSSVKEILYVDSNDIVSIVYTGSFTDGAVFDSGVINVTMGKGQVISGFEKAVLGMALNEEKTVKILSNDAYGSIDSNLIFSMPVDVLTENNIVPETGMMLQLESGAKALIRDVNETDVLLDFNHPLAGQDLVFKLRVVSIKKS